LIDILIASLGGSSVPGHNTYGVRGGRAVHGAADVSELQACNQCLCGVWVRSQLAALDKLHRIKGIFGRVTYRWFPPGTPVSSTIKSEKVLISLITGSSEGGFRSRDERKRAENM
jgi:hypothetical protein